MAVALVVARASVVLVRGLPPPVPGARPRRAELCPDCANSERKPHRCIRSVFEAFTNQHYMLFLSFPVPVARCDTAATTCPTVVTALPQTVYLARRPRTVPEGRFAPPSLGLPTVGVALSLSLFLSFFSSLKRFVFHDTLPENYLSSFRSPSHCLSCCLSLSLSFSAF